MWSLQATLPLSKGNTAHPAGCTLRSPQPLCALPGACTRPQAQPTGSRTFVCCPWSLLPGSGPASKIMQKCFLRHRGTDSRRPSGQPAWHRPRGLSPPHSPSHTCQASSPPCQEPFLREIPEGLRQTVWDRRHQCPPGKPGPGSWRAAGHRAAQRQPRGQLPPCLGGARLHCDPLGSSRRSCVEDHARGELMVPDAAGVQREAQTVTPATFCSSSPSCPAAGRRRQPRGAH